jgi:hypothetical protein
MGQRKVATEGHRDSLFPRRETAMAACIHAYLVARGPAYPNPPNYGIYFQPLNAELGGVIAAPRDHLSTLPGQVFLSPKPERQRP